MKELERIRIRIDGLINAAMGIATDIDKLEKREQILYAPAIPLFHPPTPGSLLDQATRNDWQAEISRLVGQNEALMKDCESFRQKNKELDVQLERTMEHNADLYKQLAALKRSMRENSIRS